MRGACREQKLKPLTRQQGEQSPKRLSAGKKPNRDAVCCPLLQGKVPPSGGRARDCYRKAETAKQEQGSGPSRLKPGPRSGRAKKPPLKTCWLDHGGTSRFPETMSVSENKKLRKVLVFDEPVRHPDVRTAHFAECEELEPLEPIGGQHEIYDSR